MPDHPQPVVPRRTWKLTLAYDGTDFSGWQIQPGEPTVQGELRAALGRVTGERPLPQGSGRTDAGVHALGQVASFALAAPIPPENLQRALNRTLPPSIRVLQAIPVQDSFHARHAAVAKTYEYRVFREVVCPPFLARYVHACAWSMDVGALQRSARMFEGEHDFLSFAATDPDLGARALSAQAEIKPGLVSGHDPVRGAPWAGPRAAKSMRALQAAGKLGSVKGTGFSPYINPAESIGALAPEGNISPIDPEGRPLSATSSIPQPDQKIKPPTAVRTIYSSNWEEQRTEVGNLLVYRVRGNGFLHHMVRNLVGTMLDVGRGHLDMDTISAILAARSRAAAGPTAPAQGLFLHSVEYEGQPDTE